MPPQKPSKNEKSPNFCLCVCLVRSFQSPCASFCFGPIFVFFPSQLLVFQYGSVATLAAAALLPLPNRPNVVTHSATRLQLPSQQLTQYYFPMNTTMRPVHFFPHSLLFSAIVLPFYAVMHKIWSYLPAQRPPFDVAIDIDTCVA